MKKALDKLVLSRTVIVVAHRSSTIRAADQILVSQDGAVVERGKQAQLIRVEGLYKDPWSERERAARWRLANN